MRLIRTLLPLFAGALAALGQAPFDLLPALIAGLSAVIWLTATAPRPWVAARRAWLGGTGYFAVSLSWIVEPFMIEPEIYGWMAPFALVFMAAGLALFWGLAGWLALRLRGGIWAVAAALALTDLLRSYVLTGFPWGMAAQATVDWPVYQLAQYIGPHGVNLLVLLFCATLAYVLASWRSIPAFGLSVAAALALLWPMPDVQVATDAPIVRVLQPNAAQAEKWLPGNAQKFFDRQLDFSAVPAPEAPALVVWPETAVPFLLERAGLALAQISLSAGDAHSLVGIQHSDDWGRWYNSAALVTPEGEVSDLYDKHHLVPFGEYMPVRWLFRWLDIAGLAANDSSGYWPGPGPQVIPVPGVGKVLPLICYEAIFPQDILQSPERPDLLVQITNDAWFGTFSGPYQHLAQARMRAIETGLPMVRSANTGVSAVIAPNGQVMQQIALGQDGFIDVRLPAAKPAPIYSQTGDWSALVLILGIFWMGVRFRGNISVDAERAAS
ncbi:apolipoprotein N-acyltransferase [Donghicola tyrosinivorans]|uniref:Apolipoprotein N-acyltransferase n=1 Tax=Donghicola tyrosinivorans TaxID=1652492 RepID=A0A2T0WFZ4_9RHOB|nr:apolipoprotein N-acyltransferase [Donghicola tyrosinivorans]